MQKISIKFRWDHINRALSAGRLSNSDALLPKIFIYPPWWSASMTVRWQRNVQRHLRWGCSKIVDNNYGPVDTNDFTCMWHGALRARCVIIEPIATMCVQNYTESQIKSGSCWKCSSDWHAICSYNNCHSIALVSRQ